MGTTSSVNPGLANLLQTLTNVNSPVMQSPTAVAALEKAPPGDIVQLSEEATQLQGLDMMFGLTDSSGDMTSSDPLVNSMYQNNGLSAPTDPMVAVEQALAAANGGATASTSGTTTPTVAQALANYQGIMQSQKISTLFG